MMTRRIPLALLGAASLSACAFHLDAQHDPHGSQPRPAQDVHDHIREIDEHIRELHGAHALHGHGQTVVHTGVPAHGDWQRLLRDAGLDEQMIRQLVDLHHRAMLERIDLEAAVAKAELRLAMAMHETEARIDTVNSAIDAVFAARATLGKSFAREIFAAKALLGPETWERLAPHVHAHVAEIMHRLGLGIRHHHGDASHAHHAHEAHPHDPHGGDEQGDDDRR